MSRVAVEKISDMYTIVNKSNIADHPPESYSHQQTAIIYNRFVKWSMSSAVNGWLDRREIKN